MNQATSIAAYKEIKADNTDARHREMIFKVISESINPLSAMEIAARLRLDYFQVSRRTSELCATNRIYVRDRFGKSPKGKSANRYAAFENLQQPVKYSPTQLF